MPIYVESYVWWHLLVSLDTPSVWHRGTCARPSLAGNDKGHSEHCENETKNNNWVELVWGCGAAHPVWRCKASSIFRTNSLTGEYMTI